MSPSNDRADQDEPSPFDTQPGPEVEAIRDQIELIQRMVDQSRQVRAQTGHIYLGAGVAFLLAALVDGIGYVWWDPAWSWLGWPIAGAFAGLYSAVAGPRQAKRQPRLSYAPRIEGVTWLTASVVIWTYVILGLIQAGEPPALMFPVTGLMVTLPLAVSGALYRYWPLTAGAVVFFVVAVATAFMGDVAQRLGFALAMLLGYVLPGLAILRGAMFEFR